MSLKSVLLLYFLLLFSSKAHSQTWFSDFELARKEASIRNKPILLYFSGSDWCKPCITFSKNVLETKTFKNYIEEHLVGLLIDTPRLKKNRLSKELQEHHEKLLETYNYNGNFPKVMLLSPKEQRVIWESTSFAKDNVNQFIERINRAYPKS